MPDLAKSTISNESMWRPAAPSSAECECRPDWAASGASGVVSFVDVGSNGIVNPVQPAVRDSQTYMARLLSQRAVQLIADHGKNHRAHSLYMHVAFYNVHGAFMAPCETCKHFARTPFDTRRVYDAMVEEVDDALGHIRSALDVAGMLPSAIFIVHSDNGGAVATNNYPLRGFKFTRWEGGVRVPAFVYSPLIPVPRRGNTLEGMGHVADLYATIVVGIADTPMSFLNDTGRLPSDSFNLWPAISGQSAQSPREEVVHFPLLQGDGWGFSDSDVARKRGRGEAADSPATRRGRFKLLLGWPGFHWLSNPQPPLMNESTPFGRDRGMRRSEGQCYQGPSKLMQYYYEQIRPDFNCSLQSPCLFDIVSDPSETHNVAQLHPDIVTVDRKAETRGACNATVNHHQVSDTDIVSNSTMVQCYVGRRLFGAS